MDLPLRRRLVQEERLRRELGTPAAGVGAQGKQHRRQKHTEDVCREAIDIS